VTEIKKLGLSGCNRNVQSRPSLVLSQLYPGTIN